MQKQNKQKIIKIGLFAFGVAILVFAVPRILQDIANTELEPELMELIAKTAEEQCS